MGDEEGIGGRGKGENTTNYSNIYPTADISNEKDVGGKKRNSAVETSQEGFRGGGEEWHSIDGVDVYAGVVVEPKRLLLELVTAGNAHRNPCQLRHQ